MFLQKIGKLPPVNILSSSISNTVKSSAAHNDIIIAETTTSIVNAISSTASNQHKSSLTLDASTEVQSTTINKTATTKIISDFCIKKLFGNLPENGTLPYWTLELYGATTTPPPTTTTTTLSPYEKEYQFCRALRNWSLTVDHCTDPLNPCITDLTNAVNDYMKCKSFLNGTEPSLIIVEKGPLLVVSYMRKLAKQVTNTFLQDKLNKETFIKVDEYETEPVILSNFMWLNGFKVRHKDMLWPDYHDAKFRPTKKWNNRNDSIFVPFGILPRREYRYHFALYDNLINQEITESSVRLKHEWPYRHAIRNGIFIDTKAEKGLYYNSKLEVNSALLELSLEPAVRNPLPGYVTITLTHKRLSFHKPVCVYWQYLTPLKNNLPDAGYWSNYGMYLEKTNKSMTICRATHVSSFALLMDPIETHAGRSPDWFDITARLLTVISGLILSVQITAMFLLKCFTTSYSRMYICIAIAALFSQIFFVVGFEQRSDWDSCTSITLHMEFWHVSLLTWVTVESIHQLSQVRPFFHEDTSIEALYYIIGCGFPVSIIIALQDFPFETFNELRYCWLYINSGDICYFAGPLIILALIIFLLRLITFIEIRKNSEKVKTDINYERALKSSKATAVLVPTVLLVWCLGTIGVSISGPLQTLILIILPGLNLLVGCEIAYFYFFNNDDVLDALLNEQSIRKQLRIQTYRHLAGISMKVNYVTHEDDYYENIDETDIEISMNKL